MKASSGSGQSSCRAVWLIWAKQVDRSTADVLCLVSSPKGTSWEMGKHAERRAQGLPYPCCALPLSFRKRSELLPPASTELGRGLQGDQVRLRPNSPSKDQSKGRPQLTPRILGGSILHTTGFKNIAVSCFCTSWGPSRAQTPPPKLGPVSSSTPTLKPGPRPVQAPPPPCPSVQRAALEPGPRCKSSVTRRGWPAGTNGGSRPVLGLRPWGKPELSLGKGGAAGPS